MRSLLIQFTTLAKYKFIFVQKELEILKIERKLKEVLNKMYHEATTLYVTNVDALVTDTSHACKPSVNMAIWRRVWRTGGRKWILQWIAFDNRYFGTPLAVAGRFVTARFAPAKTGPFVTRKKSVRHPNLVDSSPAS